VPYGFSRAHIWRDANESREAVELVGAPREK